MRGGTPRASRPDPGGRRWTRTWASGRTPTASPTTRSCAGCPRTSPATTRGSPPCSTTARRRPARGTRARRRPRRDRACCWSPCPPGPPTVAVGGAAMLLAIASPLVVCWMCATDRTEPGAARDPRCDAGHVRRYVAGMDFALSARPRTSARRRGTSCASTCSPPSPSTTPGAPSAATTTTSTPGPGGAEGRGAQARAVEPLPPRAGRAVQPGVRLRRRDHRLVADDRARGDELRRPRHRQHGDAHVVRHRRAEAALAGARCSRARSAPASR